MIPTRIPFLIRLSSIFVFIFSLAMPQDRVHSQSTILYASPGGLVSGACSSWATACELRYALSSATANSEIWAQQGTYYPTADSSRTATFQLKNNVAIYGGFTGSEGNLSARDWATNDTILSGDIGAAGTTTDNSYNVVTGSGTNTSAVLDGFIIENGNDDYTNGSSTYDLGGAGIYNVGGSPTIRNATIRNNLAGINLSSIGKGAGMLNAQGSSPVVTNVVFMNNGGSYVYGGGLANFSNSNPTIDQVTFTSNQAYQGGGMANMSSCNATLVSSSFNSNSASSTGGALYNGGATLTLNDVTISGNSASTAGAIYNYSSANLNISGSSISGNSASVSGAIYNVNSTMVVDRTAIANNTASMNIGAINANGGSATFTNVTFSGNQASGGTGVLSAANGSVVVKNSTFSGNRANNGDGGAIDINHADLTIYNSILWGDSASGSGNEIFCDTVNGCGSGIYNIDHNVIQGGYASGTNILTSDPGLGTLAGTPVYYPISLTSSAFNSGLLSQCTSVDIRGVARPQWTQCDMGAYEFDDPVSLIYIADVTQAEGNSGTTTFTFSITLNQQAHTDVSFDIATADGTASSADNDYAALNLTGLTIPAGELSTSQSITVNGDQKVEGDETFMVNLSNPVGAVFSESQAVGTITNDDTAGVTINPTSGLTTTEAGGTATFTVVLNSQPTADVTIGLTSSDTTEGTVSPASLTFTSADWSEPQTVTITGVDDVLVDGDISYTIQTGVAVSSDVNYSGFDPADVSVINQNDDNSTINISDGVLFENLRNGKFVVSLSEPSEQAIQFSYFISGTATAGVDYLLLTGGPCTIPAGESSIEINVTGLDDSEYEIIEYILVGLKSITGANPGDIYGYMYIYDDESFQIIQDPESSMITTEAGGYASIGYVLNAQPGYDVSLSVSNSDISEGVVSPISLVFTPSNWSTEQFVTITGVDDLIVDGDIGYQIIPTVTSNDPRADGYPLLTLNYTNQDDDSLAASLTTVIHNGSHAVVTAAAEGDPLHANAAVKGNGALTPSGDVTFEYFNNVTCSGTAAGSGTAALDASGIADMTTSTVLTAEGLSFIARYVGDSTYPAADGACTAISTSAYPTVLKLSVNTAPYDGQVLTSGINHVAVQFNMDVFHSTNSNQHSATYPGNYLLLGPGADAIFDSAASTGCLDGAGGDDVSYTINSISYDATRYVAAIGINNGVQLPVGTYRLYVCGSTSITDLAETIELNNGQDSTVTFRVNAGGSSSGNSSSKSVATGFAPGMVTRLPEQPAGLAYTPSELWIEIPALGIEQQIMGIPQTDAGWDVSWLGYEIGYLQGTAFPTWAGNSVLTGHVTGADGLPGVFADLGSLQWGDEVFIHAFGQKYVYEVRTVDLSASPDTSKVMNQHEDLPWLTLITCRGYDEKTGAYRYRTVVRAVQVSVEEE